MSLNKIGIIGSGNVGSSLLLQLASLESKIAEQIEITSRNKLRAQASIIDAGSAYPKKAAKLSAAEELKGEYDVVVVTAGILPSKEITIEELLRRNVEIARSVLKKVSSKTIILLGTPVDLVTEELASDKKFIDSQVIGFGGDLDKARIEYNLRKKNFPAKNVYAIGEHGPRTIPVYDGEESYKEIRGSVTSALKQVMASADIVRNLASGVQLARLIQSIAGKGATHCISKPDPDFNGLSITWPYKVSPRGFIKQEIEIGPKAQKALDQLIILREKTLAQSQ